MTPTDATPTPGLSESDLAYARRRPADWGVHLLAEVRRQKELLDSLSIAAMGRPQALDVPCLEQILQERVDAMSEAARLRDQLAAMRAGLEDLAHQHARNDDCRVCDCSAHQNAAELLAEPEGK